MPPRKRKRAGKRCACEPPSRKAAPRRRAKQPIGQAGGASASGKRKAVADAETSAKKGKGSAQVKPGLFHEGTVGGMKRELTELRREIRSGTVNPADMEQLALRVYNQLSTADDRKELMKTLSLLPTHGRASDGGTDLAATVLAKPGSAKMSEQLLKAMTASTAYPSLREPIDLMRRCLEKDKERDIEFSDQKGARLTWQQFAKGLGEEPNRITLSSTDRCLYVTRTQ